MKGNCNAESVFYVQQDAQYDLMLWPVLYQIIACSMTCGIGHWVNAVTEMKAGIRGVGLQVYTCSNSSSCWFGVGSQSTPAY